MVYAASISFSNGDYLVDSKNNICSVTGYCEFDSDADFNIKYIFGSKQTSSYTDSVTLNAELNLINSSNPDSPSTSAGIIAAAVIFSFLGFSVLIYAGHYYYKTYYKKSKDAHVDDEYLIINDF